MLSSFCTKSILIERRVSSGRLHNCIIHAADIYRRRGLVSILSYAGCRRLLSRGSIIGEFENMPIPGKKALATITELHKQPPNLSDVRDCGPRHPAIFCV